MKQPDTLVLILPAEGSALTEVLEYAHFGRAHPSGVVGHGRLSELPASKQIILLAPAERVSVFSVSMPKLSKNKLASSMLGLLEDRVLGDCEAQCFAPGPSSGKTIQHIASCEQKWLQTLLQEIGRKKIKHIVPEVALLRPGEAYLHRQRQQNRLLLRDKAGESVVLKDQELPANRPTGLFADPEVADAQSHRLQRNEFLSRALNHSWDMLPYLAEQKTSATTGRNWTWALRLSLALLVVNLLALNLYAAQQNSRNQEIKKNIEQIAKQAIPEAGVILNAQVQVKNALQAAQDQAGIARPSDFDVLLQQLSLLVPNQTPTILKYQNKAITATLGNAAGADALARCKDLSLRCEAKGQQLTLEPTP